MPDPYLGAAGTCPRAACSTCSAVAPNRSNLPPKAIAATAAAFYAAAALLLGRRRSPLSRALIAGGAISITVAVASTRALLAVHWWSDVIGGVLLGWAWFAVAAIAFGGRLLRFGATAEHVEQAARGQVPAATR